MNTKHKIMNIFWQRICKNKSECSFRIVFISRWRLSRAADKEENGLTKERRTIQGLLQFWTQFLTGRFGFFAILKVTFRQKVRCCSKKCAKSVSWSENLDVLLPKTVKNWFEFSAKDSDSAHFFESHWTLWDREPLKVLNDIQFIFLMIKGSTK